MPAANSTEAVALAGGPASARGAEPGLRPIETRATSGRPVPRIGLLAHVGMENLGDEVLFASALSHFRERLPQARFVAFTIGPDDTRSRYGLADVHPIRPPAVPDAESPASGGRIGGYVAGIRERLAWFLNEARFSLRSAGRLRGLDLVVVPGSSQFIDAYGGPWGFPFSLLRWTVLARLTGVPICFLSLGAEKLESPLSRRMVRWTVALATHISLRDTVSLERLRAQGVRRDIPIVPDLSLAYPAPAPARAAPGGRAGTVGINPIPYFHPVFWRAVDDARYRRYLDAMVALTADVLEKGHRVVLYATTQWADRVPARDIVDELALRFDPEVMERVESPEVRTLDELWGVLARVDWVVASRYHGVATALLMRKPVVGIAYERKTADLMGSLGLRDYSIAIDEATGPLLAALLDRLLANDAELRATLEESAVKGREAVHAQFEQILATYVSNPTEA